MLMYVKPVSALTSERPFGRIQLYAGPNPVPGSMLYCSNLVTSTHFEQTPREAYGGEVQLPEGHVGRIEEAERVRLDENTPS